MISRRRSASKLQPGPFLKEIIIVCYPISMLSILAATCLGQAQPLLGADAAAPRPPWVSMVDQKTTDPRLAGYLTPRGIKLEIVAENSRLASVSQAAFLADGELLILECKAENSAGKDIIRCVRDPAAPRAFGGEPSVLEEPAIAAMCVSGSWLYTAGGGSVQRYRRIKKDGPFEAKQIIARGFGGRGQHPPFGLSVDFDGSLLIAVGPGDHDVKGSDDSRAHVTDCGAVFRCRSDGARLEALAIGLSTPCGGVAFDSEFHGFLAETGAGGNLSRTGVLHVTEESDYGFRSLSNKRPELVDLARRGCLQNLPGVMKPIFSMPGTPGRGLCICNESTFPPFFQGLILCPDPQAHAVVALAPGRLDSSFRVTESFHLVQSADPAFLPTQLLAGPDGCLYLLDRRAPVPASGSRPEGRIYRLSWAGGPAHPGLAPRDQKSWAKMSSFNGAQLIGALDSSNGSDRDIAQKILIAHGSTNAGALLAAVENRELHNECRALAAGALCSMWNDSVQQALIRLATDDETALRRCAALCLGRYGRGQDPQIQEALLRILGDPDPATRRAVALAMARIGAPEAADCIAATLSFDIGTDLCLRDGLVRALERLGKPGLEQLLKLANSGEPDRLELAVNAFCALRAPLGLELWPQLLNNPHLANADRARLIRSLARYPGGSMDAANRALVGVVAVLDDNWELWVAASEVVRARHLKGVGGFVRLFYSLVPK
jgi:quinoprotein glucose dehydrogenase